MRTPPGAQHWGIKPTCWCPRNRAWIIIISSSYTVASGALVMDQDPIMLDAFQHKVTISALKSLQQMDTDRQERTRKQWENIGMALYPWEMWWLESISDWAFSWDRTSTKHADPKLTDVNRNPPPHLLQWALVLAIVLPQMGYNWKPSCYRRLRLTPSDSTKQTRLRGATNGGRSLPGQKFRLNYPNTS